MPRNHFIVHCIISCGANAMTSEVIKMGQNGHHHLVPHLALIRGGFIYYFYHINFEYIWCTAKPFRPYLRDIYHQITPNISLFKFLF